MSHKILHFIPSGTPPPWSSFLLQRKNVTNSSHFASSGTPPPWSSFFSKEKMFTVLKFASSEAPLPWRGFLLEKENRSQWQEQNEKYKGIHNFLKLKAKIERKFTIFTNGPKK